MRKSSFSFKRMIAAVTTLVLLAGTLSGCEYSSIDDYREELGLKDPDFNEDQDDALSSGSAQATVTDPVQDMQIGFDWESIPDDDNEESETDSSSDDSSAEATSAQTAEGSGSVIDEDLLPDKDDFEFDSPETSHALSEEEMIKARESIGLTDDAISARKKEQEGLYAYERLTDAGKTLYVEMLIIMENLASNIMVSTTSDEALEVVFDYVMADHPEIFYVGGYHYTNYSVDDEITAITFTGNYDYTPEEVASRRTRINAAVAACLSNAPSSSDEYYTIKYVYDYLINNTEYNLDAQDNQII